MAGEFKGREEKWNLDMKTSEDQPQSTTDGTPIDGITLNCGANLKNKTEENPTKTLWAKFPIS